MSAARKRRLAEKLAAAAKAGDIGAMRAFLAEHGPELRPIDLSKAFRDAIFAAQEQAAVWLFQREGERLNEGRGETILSSSKRPYGGPSHLSPLFHRSMEAEPTEEFVEWLLTAFDWPVHVLDYEWMRAILRVGAGEAFEKRRQALDERLWPAAEALAASAVEDSPLSDEERRVLEAMLTLKFSYPIPGIAFNSAVVENLERRGLACAGGLDPGTWMWLRGEVLTRAVWIALGRPVFGSEGAWALRKRRRELERDGLIVRAEGGPRP